MFIVFCGIDGCGKTTLSQLVHQRLSSKTPSSRTDFIWTKEPTFSSEQADSLNLKGMDSADREVEFMIDRVMHQEILRGSGMFEPAAGRQRHVICDRYIWSGLAYAKVFNPSVYDFVKAVYKHQFFIKPNLYIFVDTPPEICCLRRRVPAQLSNLIKLREAFLEVEPLITADSAVMRVDGTENLEALTAATVEIIGDFISEGEPHE
jgi:thymidylate kinase